MENTTYEKNNLPDVQQEEPQAAPQNNQQKNPQNGVDDGAIYIDIRALIIDVLKIFKKIWIFWLILFIMVSCGICAYFKATYVATYKSKASFTVNTATASSEVADAYGFYYDNAHAQQMAKVLPYILKSSIFDDVLKEELAVDEIDGEISVLAVKDSNLFSVEVVSKAPENAKKVIDAVIKILPDVSRYVIGDTKLNIIQPSTLPTAPNNQVNYLKLLAFSFIGCFGLCIAAIAVYAIFVKKIENDRDFAEQLNINCLGVIPLDKEKKEPKSTKGRRKSIIAEQSGQADFLREYVSHAALKITRVMKKENAKVLMITSAVENEGKSTVSWNLAKAIKQTEPERKVALVDMDFRKVTLSLEFGAQDYFYDIDDCLEGSYPESENENVVIIGAFFSDKHPEKKIESPGMKKLFDYLKENFDYVLVDTPPCAVTADPALISRYCETILFVVKQDTATKWTILDSISGVASKGCKVIGGVLNCAGGSILDYGYGYSHYGRYGYGKYGKYGYGKYGRYGYGRYGRYGGYGYGYSKYGSYGYGYGEDEPEEKAEAADENKE